MNECELPQPQTAWEKAAQAVPRFLPFLSWWGQQSPRSLKADLWAGLTGAVIVLPQGVAFAAIAGLPPQYGLYAAMVPVILAALFGSSHHLVSGPTTAISLVIFANVSHFADPGSAEYVRLVLTLTFLAGVFQLGLGIARMGAVVNFVSHSVVTGFTAGAAILIATSQLAGVTGIVLPRGGSFLSTWANLVPRLPEANPYVLGTAAATMLMALVVKRLRPRFPAMLLALLGASALAYFTGGAEHGVKLMGALPDTLPPLSWPVPGFDEVRTLVPGALAIAMLGLAEAVSIARAVAVRSQQMIDNSQEFIGQGIANVAGSFFSAYASSGSFTRTGLNFESGAKTPLAAVFSAMLLAAIVLLVAPYTAYLPLAAMGGVILLVAANLVDLHGIRHIIRTDKSEAGVLAVTFLATLFVQMEFAIFCGVILSLLMYLKRTSHPNFVVLAPDPSNLRRPLVNVEKKSVNECPQLKILRLDGSIFFGATTHISEELHRIVSTFPEQCHILIVGGGINFVDASGCHMLFNEALRMKLSGRDLFFCSLKSEVLEVLRRGMCLKRLGGEHIFETEGQAIAQMVPRLDPERCGCCWTRVFRECERMPGGEHYLPPSAGV